MTDEELVAKIQAGDNSLQEQLWLQVKRWICKLANQFFTFNYDLCTALSLDLDDFIQEAYFAMLDTIRTYKQDGGSKFSTMLTQRVKNSFRDLTGLSYAYARSDKSNQTANAIRDAASLDAPSSKDADVDLTLAECLSDPLSAEALEQIENSDYYEQMHDNLEKALNELPPKQSACIRYHYYDKMTHQQIADLLHISRTYAEHSIHTGLSTLRRCANLQEYRTRQFDRVYKGGLNSWKYSGSSIQEQIVISLDEKERQLMAYLNDL